MKEFEAGQKLTLRFKTYSFQTITISCTVKWSEKDRIALVYPEKYLNVAKNLHVGKDLEVVVYTNSGIYVFDSIVMHSPLEHDFVIEIPDEKKRMQRRDYVRAHFGFEFLLSKGNLKIKTKTINIGGGGIRFKVNEELRTNDIWDFTLYLADNTEIHGQGVILYSLLQGKITTSAMKFIDISELDRSKLIKKCFEEEVKRKTIIVNRVRFTEQEKKQKFYDS